VRVCVCVCARACVRVCARACARVRVRARARARVHVCLYSRMYLRVTFTKVTLMLEAARFKLFERVFGRPVTGLWAALHLLLKVRNSLVIFFIIVTVVSIIIFCVVIISVITVSMIMFIIIIIIIITPITILLLLQVLPDAATDLLGYLSKVQPLLPNLSSSHSHHMSPHTNQHFPIITTTTITTTPRFENPSAAKKSQNQQCWAPPSRWTLCARVCTPPVCCDARGCWLTCPVRA
jgi:hypothetical protein